MIHGIITELRFPKITTLATFKVLDFRAPSKTHFKLSILDNPSIFHLLTCYTTNKRSR